MLARLRRRVDVPRFARKNRPMFVRAVIAWAGTLVAASAVATAGMPKFIPLWQRVLQGGDLPGFIPQSSPPPLLSQAAFIRETRGTFVRLTPSAVSARLAKDGFRHAVIETLAGRT